MTCPICEKIEKGFIMSMCVEYDDLNDDQRKEVRELIRIVLKAVSPNDSTGHLPKCGYTNETPDCGCADVGTRLFTGLSEYVAKDE